MKDQNLLEEAYLSTGNSGVQIKIYKQKDTRDHKYFLNISHGAFGHRTEVTTPLINVDHARGISEMLARVANRMEQDRVWDHDESREFHNNVRDGHRYNPIYREYVTGTHSSTRYICGYEVCDVQTGVRIRDEMFDHLLEHSCSGAGSTCEPLYKKEDIGRPIVNGHIDYDGGRINPDTEIVTPVRKSSLRSAIKTTNTISLVTPLGQ